MESTDLKDRAKALELAEEIWPNQGILVYVENHDNHIQVKLGLGQSGTCGLSKKKTEIREVMLHLDEHIKDGLREASQSLRMIALEEK